MSEAFLKVVNMSISAGWLVLAVLALRLILKKAPKWVNDLLWGIVAVRLICPFSIESALSLIPSTETISPEIMMDWTPEISTGIEPLDQVVNPVISTSFAPQGMASANPLQILIPMAANLWLLGVLILLTYTAISYLTLWYKLRTAVILRDNVFQCETVSSPFVLGILKPRIFLPYAMDDKNLSHVIAHEKAHIRRKDHWWKPLGFLLLTVYWFNPLMWVAYILLCRDIELACDEKVIAELGNEQRADYTQALVACAVNRRMIAACPLAFGEVGVKDRVKSIMNYRKPTFWIIVIALVVCIVVAVCFLTDPNPSREFSMNSDNVSDLNPEAIVERIMDIENIDNGSVYTNSNNFSLQVDSDFNWFGEDSQAVRYFFSDSKITYSGQLRIFPNTEKYLILPPTEREEQQSIFLLRHYLDAIKYLPQNAIREMAPADQYIIQQREEGRPSDYDRVITYSSEGVEDTDGWYIHLQIQPLHEDGGQYHGTCDEVLDVFYGESYGSIVTPDNIAFGLYDLEVENAEITEVKLRNLHNGKDTVITNPAEIQSIAEFFTKVQGANRTSSKGYYGGSYEVQLCNGSRTVLSICFGDDDSFNCGDYGDGYPARYELWGVTREDVIRFLSQFDSSDFDWGLPIVLNAKLLEIHDGYYLVEPVEGSWELNSASQIEVPMKNMESSPEPEIGDMLLIEYDGQLAETYPARITNPLHISVLVEVQTSEILTGFEFNFAGNTSGGQKMELTEEKPYWCITVVNEGTNGINIDILGTIYMVDAGSTGHIYPDKAWEPGTYSIDFGTAGGIGMEGYAICNISSAPFLAEEPFARKIYSAERRADHPLVVYISSEWAVDKKPENVELPFNHLSIKEDGSGVIDGVDVTWEICDKYTSEQSLHIELWDDNEYVVSVVYWRDSQLLQIVDQNENLLECYYHRIAYATG